MAILEINLRRKWPKDLQHLNIVLEKYTEGDEFFNPMEFFEKYDNEKYFTLLVDWKIKNEKQYLESKPWLNRGPIIQAKALMKSPLEDIRG